MKDLDHVLKEKRSNIKPYNHNNNFRKVIERFKRINNGTKIKSNRFQDQILTDHIWFAKKNEYGKILLGF